MQKIFLEIKFRVCNEVLMFSSSPELISKIRQRMKSVAIKLNVGYGMNQNNCNVAT